MHRCMFVMLLVVLCLPVRADRQQLLDWLYRMPEHGIDVEAGDWQVLVDNPSNRQIHSIVARYATYLDTGRLDRRLYQATWKLDEKAALKPSGKSLTLTQLESLPPRIPEYALLQKSLKQLRHWQSVAAERFPDDLIFFEGDRHPAIQELNQWLWDLDLADTLPDREYTQLHKDILTQVQLQFDLGPDGRLGANTRQALLAITNDRIRILKANLERLRWLPQELPYPHVRVDIAGFNVAWVEGRLRQFLHKAIIGTRHKQTPIFNDEIEGVTYNPVWKVPHSIAANSMLRAEKKKPGFLKEEGFVVYESWDDRAPKMDIDRIDWRKLTPNTFRYRLEQQPGEMNRLGRFKLNLPNEFGVYLHDTDKPELFDEKRRSFSSGCTRVHGIDVLVKRLTTYQSPFQLEKPPEGGSRETFKQTFTNTIPVYFVYFTAWPDADGRVRFREDIYQQDRAMVSWF